MYIGYTNKHTGHNERRTSRHDTHTYHHQKTHDWLTDWLGFSSIFSTIRLYRALKTYSLVNRLNAELSTKLMNNLTKPTLLKLSHLKGVLKLESNLRMSLKWYHSWITQWHWETRQHAQNDKAGERNQFFLTFTRFNRLQNTVRLRPAEVAGISSTFTSRSGINRSSKPLNISNTHMPLAVTQNNFNDRAFHAAGPWVYLPTNLRQPDLSYSHFRESLMTLLSL